MPFAIQTKTPLIELGFTKSIFEVLMQEIQAIYFGNNEIDKSIIDELYQGSLQELVYYIHHAITYPKLEAADIIKILPHGMGFILVDKVTSICFDDKNPSIRGTYNASVSAWWAPEHMPGNPLMPGVLMIEGLNQVAGLLLYFLSDQQKQPVVFVGSDKYSIHRQAVPGDKIEYFVSLEKSKRGIFVFNGQVYVNGYKSIKTRVKLVKT